MPSAHALFSRMALAAATLWVVSVILLVVGHAMGQLAWALLVGTAAAACTAGALVARVVYTSTRALDVATRALAAQRRHTEG